MKLEKFKIISHFQTASTFHRIIKIKTNLYEAMETWWKHKAKVLLESLSYILFCFFVKL